MQSNDPNKELNVKEIAERLDLMSLSESKLASELGVSRQIISNWMKKEKFPRPEKLLKLSKILKMSFNEMVIRKESVTEPVVAFRKKGGHKISPDYLENAKHMGTLLEQLVPYLPFDINYRPPSLMH